MHLLTTLLAKWLTLDIPLRVASLSIGCLFVGIWLGLFTMIVVALALYR